MPDGTRDVAVDRPVDDRQKFAAAVFLKVLRSGWQLGYGHLVDAIEDTLSEDERRVLWHILSGTFREGQITDMVREWVSYDRFPHGMVQTAKMRQARKWAKGKAPETLKSVAVAAFEEMTPDDAAAFAKYVKGKANG